MGPVFRSLGIGEKKCDSAKTLKDKKWSQVDNCFLIIGVFSVFYTLWLGWRYGKFEAISTFLQEGKPGPNFSTMSRHRGGHGVNISIVISAVKSGAVCLDGSPPAYYLDRGSGEGANNWILSHEGGAWCENDDACLLRSYTNLGSSRQMPRRTRFTGILSRSAVTNPEFHNWNRVLLKYCDGASFNGDVSDPVEVGLPSNPLINGKASVVFYRGNRVWKAMIEDLMERGMKNAQKALLMGRSAGGLATILHCDQYRDLMPNTTLVKCLSDAGFFNDVPDISGQETIANLYAAVVKLQNMAQNLPEFCTSERDAARCIFPQYIIAGVKTPLFILNSAYDTWVMDHVLVPPAADPLGTWDDCKKNVLSCSDAQLRVLGGFRNTMLKNLQPLLEREKDGAYINSCYFHSQAHDDFIWNGPRVENKSIAEVVGDWYFGRNSTKVVDCPAPCNPTCPGANLF